MSERCVCPQNLKKAAEKQQQPFADLSTTECAQLLYQPVNKHW